MRILSTLRLLPLFFLMVALLYNCQRDPSGLKPQDEASGKAKNKMRGAKIDAADPVVVGPYTVTFKGTSTNGLTWTYEIQRTGAPQGNGLSHWIIGLGSCVAYTDVVSATIDGQPYTSLSDSEGGGTGCATTGVFLKFDNLPSGLSDGQVHTFAFTLAYVVDAANNPTWVKPGNACYQETVVGPGCYHICGAITKEAVQITTTNSSTVCATDPNSVTTSSNTETTSLTSAFGNLEVGISQDGVPNSTTLITTNGDGTFCFSNIRAGTYTITPTVTTGETAPNVIVSIKPSASQTVTVPPSSESTSFTVTTTTSSTVVNDPVVVSCAPPVCSFSQGYWFAKPDITWPSSVIVKDANGNTLYTYTQAEGKAIWNASNAGGIPDAKKVFLQFATLQLSAAAKGYTLSQYPSSVQADYEIMRAYLASISKVTTSNYKNLPSSSAAKAAADRFSTWLNQAANHCSGDSYYTAP